MRKTDVSDFQKTVANYPAKLKKLIKYKFLRKMFSKQLDRGLSDAIVGDENTDIEGVRQKRYEFISAMLNCVTRNLDKKWVSKQSLYKLVEVMVENTLIRERDKNIGTVFTEEQYKEKYGEYPPTFLVVSPTQACNLKCIGCYASSEMNKTNISLPYDVTDRIITEAHDILDNRFMTISGGEPFAYRDGGKTLLDLFEKHSDMFFLVYTNGTLINDEVAARLAKLSNVTPAISVEGMEEETDARRGKGVYKKILEAFANLRKHGVPFGISVTATKKNFELLSHDDFYDFYFKEQGANYMWQFQFMPIGRGFQQDSIDLMITPEQRVKLFRKWEYLLKEKRYCVADFWNSGMLSRGCIAYARRGGYAYINWHGNVSPCVFIPYYENNICDIYKEGKTIVDALNSPLMKNGRKWQMDYALCDCKKPGNWLMPCSIRDHYENFVKNIVTKDTKPQDESAKEALESEEYTKLLKDFDSELKNLTKDIWEKEYLKKK